MPFPQYQVNLGYDPLLAGVASPVDYITQLDNQIQQLTAAKSQIQSQLGNPNQNMQPAQPVQPQQVNLWDEIDKEVCSLNNDQQAILAKDDVYNNISAELQMLIQQELINSVRDKVANSPRGKELLEKQLLGKMTDNLIVAATKEYPDLFGGVTIGNGKIKIGVPGIDKDIVLEAADIDHFKSCLK